MPCIVKAAWARGCWEGEADGLKKAVAHGFQEQRHEVGCTCLHMTDIVTKTNLQDYGPRCLCLFFFD